MKENRSPTAIQYLIQHENHREVSINLNSISVSLVSSNPKENMTFLVQKALKVLKDTKNW